MKRNRSTTGSISLKSSKSVSIPSPKVKMTMEVEHLIELIKDHMTFLDDQQILEKIMKHQKYLNKIKKLKASMVRGLISPKRLNQAEEALLEYVKTVPDTDRRALLRNIFTVLAKEAVNQKVATTFKKVIQDYGEVDLELVEKDEIPERLEKRLDDEMAKIFKEVEKSFVDKIRNNIIDYTSKGPWTEIQKLLPSPDKFNKYSDAVRRKTYALLAPLFQGSVINSINKEVTAVSKKIDRLLKTDAPVVSTRTIATAKRVRKNNSSGYGPKVDVPSGVSSAAISAVDEIFKVVLEFTTAEHDIKNFEIIATQLAKMNDMKKAMQIIKINKEVIDRIRGIYNGAKAVEHQPIKEFIAKIKEQIGAGELDERKTVKQFFEIVIKKYEKAEKHFTMMHYGLEMIETINNQVMQ